MRTKTVITKTCEHCGASFQAYAYLAKKGYGKYCSQQCYQAHRWQQGGICVGCGKPTTTRFCSPDCQRQYHNRNDGPAKNKRFWERKLALIKTLGGKCSQCGNDDVRVLAIHHIDPATKVRAKNGQWAWSRRLRDWAKNSGNLDLLCANCHRILTWNQMGYGSGVELPESSV